MALAQVSLDDRYALERGRVLMTGIQALVRLPLMQRRLDRKRGLSTAGLVSGYLTDRGIFNGAAELRSAMGPVPA